MNLIAAADKNWAIGKNQELLVRIPEDMKNFRRLTEGNVVVMGRRTLESFPGGRPLPNRKNLVLTTREDYDGKGAVAVRDMQGLREELARCGEKEIFVIGGGTVYRALLPYCRRAFITKLDYAYEADTWMPDLDRTAGWHRRKTSEEKTFFDVVYYFMEYENENPLPLPEM